MKSDHSVDAEEIIAPDSLRNILALAVCCQNKWASGATAALRRIWTEASSDDDATAQLKMLHRVLSPQERYWLGTYSGDRKEVLA